MATYLTRPGQIDWNRYRATPGGAITMSPALEAELQGTTNQIRATTAAKLASQRRWERGAKIASAAIIGGAAAPALFGGGAAASAPSFGLGAANTGAWASGVGAAPAVAGVAGSTLPAAASGMTMGKILSSPALGLGVNSAMSIIGQRAANNATRYQTDRNAEAVAKQIALEEQRLASETSERQAQRVEDQRRWEAEEAYKAKVLAASEEERLYARAMADKRQARVDAYDPIRQRALRSVGSILGF